MLMAKPMDNPEILITENILFFNRLLQAILK